MAEACCFVTPSGRVAAQCPETGRPTKVVDVFTVQHHALPALVGRVRLRLGFTGGIGLTERKTHAL